MNKEPYIYINNEPRTAQDLEGYLKLMSYKFKIYLGSCSRYIQNKRLKEIKYEGSWTTHFANANWVLTQRKDVITIGYIRLNENPHGILVDDCVIRAISTATGRTWDDVYMDLMVEGFEHKDLPNKNAIWWYYLQRKGYKRYLIPNTCPLCYTLKDFVKDHPHGVYIVGDGNHVVAVVDSYYIDTYNSGNMSVLYYWTTNY